MSKMPLICWMARRRSAGPRIPPWPPPSGSGYRGLDPSTSRLRRVFSRSSSFIRFTASRSVNPYSVRQRCNDISETLSDFATSSSAFLARPASSTSRNFATTSSGRWRFRVIKRFIKNSFWPCGPFGSLPISGGPVLKCPVISGAFDLKYIAIFVIAAVMFCITFTRAFRAALSHPSRRPAGIAALITAFALLDASLLAAISAPFLAATCITLWFATRWLQKHIPGS